MSATEIKEEAHLRRLSVEQDPAWPTRANNIRTTGDAVRGGTVLQRSGVYISDPMPMAMIRGVGTIVVA